MTAVMESTQSASRSIADLLRRHGIRMTPQRAWIASLLLSGPRHVSADELVELARQEGRKVSRATVYNTLNLLHDRGLARKVAVDVGRIFYDSNTSAHYHVYNVDAGTLSDVPIDAVAMSGMPELPCNTVSVGVEVIILVRNRLD